MGGLWPAPNFSSSLTPAIRPPLAVARFLAGVERERDNQQAQSFRNTRGFPTGDTFRSATMLNGLHRPASLGPCRQPSAGLPAQARTGHRARSETSHPRSSPSEWQESRDARLSRSLRSFSFSRNLAAQNAKQPVSKPAARPYGLGASEAIRFPVSRSRFHRARSEVYCAS